MWRTGVNAVPNLSYEEVETLLQIARDATLGDSFEERLRAVTEYLNVLVPCTSLSTMVVPDAGHAPTHFVFRNGSPENLLRYATQYLAVDPMAIKGRMERNLGKVVCLSDYAPSAKFGRDAFTGEFLALQGIRHVLGLSLVMPDGSLLALAMHRDAGLGDFSPKERQIVGLAQIDIGRAAFATLLREKVERLATSDEARKDAPLAGRLVFDAHGDLVRADDGALEVCGLLGGLQGRFPADLFVGEVRRLAQAVGRSAERLHPLAGGGSVVARLDSVQGKRGGIEVVAHLELERSEPRDRLEETAERFGLTRRERQVAELVSEGLGNRHVGFKLGMSEITVGTHLTRIYRKTGVSGRTDLVRLLLGDDR